MSRKAMSPAACGGRAPQCVELGGIDSRKIALAASGGNFIRERGRDTIVAAARLPMTLAWERAQ
jgi:hypothetical protein